MGWGLVDETRVVRGGESARGSGGKRGGETRYGRSLMEKIGRKGVKSWRLMVPASPSRGVVFGDGCFCGALQSRSKHVVSSRGPPPRWVCVI
jgi:hypothetical protein